MSQRIAGVDEAGRGPVIGPLVIAGIVIIESQEEALIEWGIRDSKRLTPRRRETLNHQIIHPWEIFRINFPIPNNFEIELFYSL